MRARFERKVTVQKDEVGASYVLGKIDDKYVNDWAAPLTTYTAIGSLSAEVNAYVDTSGNIAVRINGATNPTYFYVAGAWSVDV